jgi:hypothetical protein
MTQMMFEIARRLDLRRQDGVAIVWLILGILIGVGLVIFGIIKFLIPGD